VRNYVEPFFGSGAVLLGRPRPFDGPETVNDADGFIANFWRALRDDPEQVAYWADQPVNENDQHAVHAWLVGQRDGLTRRLEGDPDWYDAKVAGRWVWGICCWIGSGWCSGNGPWRVVDGQLVHLGNEGRGVHRKRVHLMHNGHGVHSLCRRDAALYAYMQALAERLRYVRVCCGDWARVCGPTPTVKQGLTGVFLDPPYATEERTANLYRIDTDVSAAVRQWAIERGDDPRIRIALCGYESPDHQMPSSWECVPWKAAGGYGNQGNGRGRENAFRERIWFSPHCVRHVDLFAWAASQEHMHNGDDVE
jgi:DNA adenine methylase